MHVAIVVVAYNQPEWLAELFATAVSSINDLVYRLYLHSTDAATA